MMNHQYNIPPVEIQRASSTVALYDLEGALERLWRRASEALDLLPIAIEV